MTRRGLRFQLSQGGARRDGACGDRNQQITAFFKPSCKPERDVFNSALRESVSKQTQGVESFGNKKTAPSRRRRKIPALSPNKSPIMEAFLRSQKEHPTIVVLEDKGGYKICTDGSKTVHGCNNIVQHTPFVKSGSLSKTMSMLPVTGRLSPWNNQYFDDRGHVPINGQEHSPVKSFILVGSDLQASSDFNQEGIIQKKTMRQTFRKSGSNEFVPQVNGTSLSNKSTCALTSNSEAENGNSSLKRKLLSQNGSNSSGYKNLLSKRKRCLSFSPTTKDLNHSFSPESTQPESSQSGDGVLTQQKASRLFEKSAGLKAWQSLPQRSTSLLKWRNTETGLAYGSPVTISEEENSHEWMRSGSSLSDKESKITAFLDARSALPELNKLSTDTDCSSSPDSSNDDFRKPKRKTCHKTFRDSFDSDESLNGFSLSSDDEEETFKPLDEILQMATQPMSATPQKPLNLSLVSLSQSPAQQTPVTRNVQPALQTPVLYINNLDRLVKEKEESERLDEMEKRLHEDIEKGLGVSGEEMEHNGEDGELTDEHRAFLKKFTLVSNAIPDHHPGEVIFCLSESGAIFNHRTLDLKHSGFSTGSADESVIFSCGPENRLMLAMEGFLTFVYRFKKCPDVLMKWMFQMVSVHPSYCTSVKILNTLIEITCNNLTNLKEKPWTPSLLDIATVFANMGIDFKTLFPLPLIQPSFNAIDLVSAVPASGLAEHRNGHSKQAFYQIPEFHIAHVIKFLAFCTAVYRESFHDLENLALIVLLLKIHLEKELKDFPVVDLHCLIENLLQNIKDWERLMPELCYAISELSSHHHNFIKLLQLVPTCDARGRQVRRHVSLIFISNILYRNCTEIPLDYDSQMKLLCRSMSQMKPSLLVKKMQIIPENQSKTLLDLDQEAYYRTFSLLHLVNDASNSDESPSVQRKYVLKLCTELEKHIKSDIREDARFFYRTKVKDLIARIHGRWQELLLYSRPNQGKLHDYWEPVCDSSSPPCSQENVNVAPQEHFLDNDSN